MPSAGISAGDLSSAEGAIHLAALPQEQIQINTIGETDTAKVKLSFIRKLWLIIPWIVMALIANLGYESIGLAVFVLSLIALILAFLSKKQRKVSKTPEVLSLLLAAVATAVEVVNPDWILHIAFMLGILGTLLFIVIGNIKLED